ncbi:MAG TPA: type II secretion system F family protein [Candidatus Saccharimonas sp.]|jgi:type IV pilus assembly protein PilC|nr:type II secretion system F family protein [Candidatus Saccharimonas sp.]
MPSYLYTATNTQGKVVSGAFDAQDRPAALAMMSKQSLSPISLKEGTSKKVSFTFLDFLGTNRIKNDDLVMFTRQLSAMVSAGVPILRALTSLHDHTNSKALKIIVEGIIKNVEGGSTFADALAKYPNAFNDVYVNMVRAGEAAGILDDILKRLAVQQEKNATMRKKIKSAMTYPMVLIFITIVAFFGLMLFVIPKIGGILKDLGGADAKLPPLTLAMLAISDFLLKYGLFLLPVVVAAIILLMRYLKTPTGRSIFHHVVLKLPIITPIIQKVAVARFARTFSALMGAGVAVLEALNVTAHAVGNVVYEQALIDAAEQVKNGKTLSSVIAKNELFPPIVAQMLAVGEETGQTDTVLVKVADFYEEEVDVAIDGLSSIIEPVMIVVMGSMVGLIAASVMGPIAGLAQSIKS